MKVKNGQILEATISELKREWQKNEWDDVYAFDEYLKIQTEQNGIKVKDDEEQSDDN